MQEFVTNFEGFLNDFNDFLSRPDNNLTMAGKATQEHSRLRRARYGGQACLPKNASAGKPLEEHFVRGASCSRT